MAIKEIITANCENGQLSKSKIARQWDDQGTLIQFAGYPEPDTDEQLIFRLIVWMRASEDAEPDELPPIELEADQWLISNYYTQLPQMLRFQLCITNADETYEKHSPIFSGIVDKSLSHDGEEAEIDVIPLFDPYKKYVDELVVDAGARVVDTELDTTSTNLVQNKAVATAVTALNGRLGQQEEQTNAIAFGSDIVPSLVWSNGQIKADDGTMGTVTSYKHTDMIAVSPGMLYTVTSRASTSFLILAMYANETDTIADTTKSVKGSNTAGGVLETVSGEIPEGINYVRVGCATAEYESAGIKFNLENIPALSARIATLNEAVFGGSEDVDFGWESGYIRWSDGERVSNSLYRVSKAMAVSEGMMVSVNTTCSSSGLAVAMYADAEDTVAIPAKSIRGFDSVPTEVDGIVPPGITAIRFVCLGTYLNDFSATIAHIPQTAKLTQAENELKKKIRNPYIYARRPVVGFILDKDFEHNAEMHTVFHAHNCPWAVALVYNQIVKFVSIPQYLYWEYFEELEVLVHGSYALPTPSETYTDEQVKGFIKSAYTDMVGYGFNPKGYIAGAGLMADKYIPYVQGCFNWGATRANHSADGEPCAFFRVDSPYKLWRYSMQASTLEQMKAAVDRAISETGLLLFYGHAQDGMLQNFTAENLDALLTYIEASGATVMKPSDAVESYYSIRYDDVIV